MVALGSVALAIASNQPPPDLAKRIAERETETRNAQSNYTYRQSVTVDELTHIGAVRGQYREVRDIIFSPEGERSEILVGKPLMTLQRLRLVNEDFHDIRHVQPFLFTTGELKLYETKVKGDEVVNGVDCWEVQIRPKQILAGQRLFDGVIWASKADYSIVRTQGRAVPQIRGTRKENLFPRFTTIRAAVDGKNWFPVHTYADDILDFRTGPQRIRLVIKYTNYKRFATESVFRFEGVSSGKAFREEPDK